MNLQYILIALSGVFGITLITLLALILKRLSFSGLKSRIQSQIGALENKIDNNDDNSELIESIGYLRNSIDNMSLDDSTSKNFPTLSENPFESTNSFMVKVGSGVGRVFVVENKITKQQFLFSKDFSIAEWKI